MPTASEELRRLLGEFNERFGAELSMVVSRTGAAIAHEGPRDVNAETFAGLAATLMNAAEVIYSSLNRPPPTRIVVDSGKGTLVSMGLGAKALFVALGPSREKLDEGIDDITSAIRGVLASKA